MPLYLLHGDNQFQSRSSFHQLLEKYQTKGFADTVDFNGKKASLDDIIQATESGSFFGGDRLVTIDSLLSSPISNRQKKIIDHISNLNQEQAHVILWEPKIITPAKQKKLSNFSIKVFKTSPAIFKFLDSFGGPNPNRTLQAYLSACDQDSPEFVFYMLIKRIRQLLQVGADTLKLAPWQISKLQSQLDQFKQDQLVDFHKDLYWLDVRQKSGKLTIDLQSDLQYLILKNSNQE